MVNNRFHRFQRVIALVAIAVLVMPLVGSRVQAAGKVLRYQAAGEPKSIDPQVGSYTDGVAYDHALFASLLRYDKNNQPSPWIAKEVPTLANGDISKDGKTYTYKLRNDWKWSDGTGVVKAQDVVYAFQRLADPRTAAGYGSFLNGLLVNNDTINNTDPAKVDQKVLDSIGVKAVDDFTVQFTLVHAASYFNQIASLWFAAPVRKDNVERSGLPGPDAWTDPAYGPLVGTGPFILKTWDHNKQMVFVKNPNYGGTPAKLDEVDLPIIQDTAVSYAGYKSGELDIAYFPTVEYNNIAADPTLSTQLVKYNLSCSYYLGFDNTRAPFNNKDVRAAFTYALNRDLYVKVISQGLATKQLSFLPDGVAGYDPKLGAEYDFNADKAAAALTAAGFPGGKGFPDVNFNYIAGANGQRRADFLKAQFKKVLGVDITENPLDSAVYEQLTTDATNKIPGMEVAGWCSDYLHPSDWLYPVFGSNGKAGNANNINGFSSAAYDKAAQAADNEIDPTKALALYQAAHKILVDSFAAAFIENLVQPALISPNVVRSSLTLNSLDGGEPGSFFWEEIDVK